MQDISKQTEEQSISGFPRAKGVVSEYREQRRKLEEIEQDRAKYFRTSKMYGEPGQVL